MELKKARLMAKSLEPVVRIGKNGISESIINEVRKLLRKRGIIKIKLLHSFLEDKDRKITSKELADKFEAMIVEQTGGIVVLMKKY